VIWVAIAVAGGLGAASRYLVDRLVATKLSLVGLAIAGR
jgi:fluoride ion exporter CrcB/FEX